MDWREPRADVAVIAADGMEAVVWAIKQRRLGVSVVTQFSGNRNRQYKRGMADALEVIDLDQLNRDAAEIFSAVFGEA